MLAISGGEDDQSSPEAGQVIFVSDDWRRRVGIEPTLRRFRAETTVLKTAGATRPHSPPRVGEREDSRTGALARNQRLKLTRRRGDAEEMTRTCFLRAPRSSPWGLQARSVTGD